MTVNVNSVVIKYETKEEIIKFIEKHPKETIDIFFPWYNKLLENPELFNKFYIEICSRNNSNSVMLIDELVGANPVLQGGVKPYILHLNPS